MEHDDHYVSQTYLKHFTGANGDLVPYYKSGHVIVGKAKSPKSLCFETEGDTNKYFPNTRLLDEFLQAFENPWNKNIAKLEDGYLDANMKFELSGYIAFLRSCNPTAKRLGQQQISGVVKPTTYDIFMSTLEKNKELSVEIKTLLKKEFQDNKIGIEVDREFAHAQGMMTLMGILHRFYCSHWLVLINDSSTPFITSDNPAVLYYKDNNPQIGQTYIPLKPNMAILITPDLSIERPSDEDVKRYDNSQDRFCIIKPSYVEEFNKQIIKSAEKIVIHQCKEDWLKELVQKYRNWRMEAIISHLPTEKGVFTILRQRPVEIRKGKK
jgi:hypothetical protein